MSSLGVVPDFVTGFHPNPLRNRTILLLFLGQESLDSESLVRRLRSNATSLVIAPDTLNLTSGLQNILPGKSPQHRTTEFSEDHYFSALRVHGLNNSFQIKSVTVSGFKPVCSIKHTNLSCCASDANMGQLRLKELIYWNEDSSGSIPRPIISANDSRYIVRVI